MKQFKILVSKYIFLDFYYNFLSRVTFACQIHFLFYHQLFSDNILCLIFINLLIFWFSDLILVICLYKYCTNDLPGTCCKILNISGLTAELCQFNMVGFLILWLQIMTVFEINSEISVCLRTGGKFTLNPTFLYIL